MDIYIVVDTVHGDLTVIPTSARVDKVLPRDDEKTRDAKKIRWKLFTGSPVKPGAGDTLTVSITRVKRGDFLLVFDDAEAFGQSEIRRGDEVLPQKPGLYHYKVAACIGGKVYADVYCPTIIIR